MRRVPIEAQKETYEKIEQRQTMTLFFALLIKNGIILTSLKKITMSEVLRIF